MEKNQHIALPICILNFANSLCGWIFVCCSLKALSCVHNVIWKGVMLENWKTEEFSHSFRDEWATDCSWKLIFIFYEKLLKFFFLTLRVKNTLIAFSYVNNQTWNRFYSSIVFIMFIVRDETHCALFCSVEIVTI